MHVANLVISTAQLVSESLYLERLVRLSEEIGSKEFTAEYRRQFEYNAAVLKKRLDSKRVRKQ